MKNEKLFSYFLSLSLGALISQSVFSFEPIQLENKFNPEEIKRIKETGNSSIHGKAFITLKNNISKGCAGFGVELLPAAKYSDERIFKTYGNNDHGQILLEDNPPKFTPDVKEYHDMVIKTQCNEDNEFSFKNLSPGQYYVIAFIIWEHNEKGNVIKSGGASMKRVNVTPNTNHEVMLKR